MALGDDVKKANDELKDFKSTLIGLDDAITSIGQSITNDIKSKLEGADDITKEFAKSFSQDLTRSIKSSGKELDNIDAIQKKINAGQDASKEITKALTKIQEQRAIQLRKIAVLERSGVDISEILKFNLEEQYNTQTALLKSQTKLVSKRKEDLGLVGKLTSGVQGVLKKAGAGGIADMFNFDDANQQATRLIRMQSKGGKVQLSTMKKTKITTAAIAKNIDKSAVRLGVAGALFKVAGALFDAFKKQDQVVTDIARNLSTSKEEATKLKGEMFESSKAAGAFGITIHDQVEAVNALNKGLGGTALSFNKDIREGAADTLKRLKLSEEAVSNMGTLAMATGKSFKVLEKEQAKGVLDAEREFGVRLNLKSVLDESNKITGIARVNAMGIEGGLAKAVATAKSLGIEMSAVASSAGQLLDFESSIQKELEAELLIGRDLNLEKARAAALAGDQEALAKALVEEAGSLEELQGMNVVAQQSLAAALGMSADELANSLMTGEALSTQAQADLDRDAQKALQQEKMLSLTEKQAVAMEKFSETVGMLGKGLLIAAAAAAAVAIAMTFGVASLPILAGIALAGAAVGGIAATVADGVAPPGKGPFTITDRFGATDITAAGDGIAVSPNINTQGGAGGNANMGETNMLLKQILSKEGTVQMDSTEVGTAFSIGSRQIQ
tara:strand:- start:7017 stop:9032 length:2016 start_codon:yes stop_codon:yes gene_type:complete